MQPTRRLHCWIVCVNESGAASGELPRGTRTARNADPFIAGLIAKLQAEVRSERRRGANPSRFDGRDFQSREPLGECAEAELTWRDAPLYFNEIDFDTWERGAATTPSGRR